MTVQTRKLKLKTALSALSDLAMPRVCVVCGRELLLQEKNICLPCLEDMPLTYHWLRDRNPMADKLNAVLQNEEYEPYSYACALFFYDSIAGYSNIPQSLKYERNFSAGRQFAAMLGEKLARAAYLKNVDAVIPVPLHRLRRFKRGYNQAEIIAREAAAALGAPLRTDILLRSRRTRTQTRLSFEGKKNNVSGAFRVSKKALKEGLSAKHILLIDDVFTTGATLGECHRTIRAAFGPGLRISVATLACVM